MILNVIQIDKVYIFLSYIFKLRGRGLNFDLVRIDGSSDGIIDVKEDNIDNIQIDCRWWLSWISGVEGPVGHGLLLDRVGYKEQEEGEYLEMFVLLFWMLLLKFMCHDRS